MRSKSFSTVSDEENPEDRYWEDFDTLEDAVLSRGKQVEVFEVTRRSLGQFKPHYSKVKVKKIKTK